MTLSSGVSKCSRPKYMVPQIPFGRDTICPRQYTSALPNLTTPLTVSVFYYESNAYPSAYPGTPGYRTTTVLSGTWPILTPASTAPGKVLASYLAIRWKEADFNPEKSVAPSETASSTGEAVLPTGVSTVVHGPDRVSSSIIATSSPECENCTQESSAPSPANKASTKGVVVGVLSSIAGVCGMLFGVIFCRSRRKKNKVTDELELDERDIHPIGCTELYSPEDPVLSEVDIVFVHGLRGHPARTWTKEHCYWPRDLLPKWRPDARVITFGYDASVARLIGNPSSNNINSHSRSLLDYLIGFRQQAPQRPLIFVAHSLGGLVVKDALQKAREDDDDGRYWPIFEATYGIIFLGTPHHGSSYASFGRWIAGLVNLIFRDTNIALLRSIERDSEILERISDAFRRTVKRGSIKVFSFTEELSMSSLLSPIVPYKSGRIGIEEEVTGTIHANHRDMCRFKNDGDPGFRRILYVIDEFVDGVVKRRQLEVNTSTNASIITLPGSTAQSVRERGSFAGTISGSEHSSSASVVNNVVHNS